MPKGVPMSADKIFAKSRLRPSQMRTVARRRFADAEYLCKSGDNERANGSMYLAGFVIECLLKAKLFERYKWLQSTRSPAAMAAADHEVWSLCYRSHDLDELLAHLPDLANRLSKLPRDAPGAVLNSVKRVCGSWTIFARYSPHSATIHEAEDFLARVKEIKECLS
jgi:hypothetical protein